MYKALRGGVQDVAVKFLHRTSDEDINRFVEVLFTQRPLTDKARNARSNVLHATWSGLPR